MADSYVCSGATMKCTMGTSQARLKVLPDRTVYLTGKPMANISDHKTMVNLGAFGRCRSMGFPSTASATAANHGTLTPMPCMHNTPFPWMGGKADYIVKGQPALLKSSKCQCMWGGTISIVDDGQAGEGAQTVAKKQTEEFFITEENISNTENLSIDSVLDGIQVALDVAGFAPGLGAIPDLANAAISALRGDWTGAGMSVLAAVPLIGDAASGTKIAIKGVNAAKKTNKARKISKTADEAIKAKDSKFFIAKDISHKELTNKGLSAQEANKFLKQIKSERRNDAFDFYKKYTKWDDAKIESHIRGIDYSKPVIRETIPPKGEQTITLYQYKGLSKSGKKYLNGQYYTQNPKATPSDLGISNKYGIIEVYREKFSINIQNSRPVLRSTARGVDDTWSIPGRTIPTRGGAEQIFIPFKKWLL